MKRAFSLIVKFGVTLGIFVGIFLEFDGWMPCVLSPTGCHVPVSTAQLRNPESFAVANPAYPGLVGRVKAKLSGAALPPALLPASLTDVCNHADERAVFVRNSEGEAKRFKPLRHCTDKGFAMLYRRSASGDYEPVAFDQAPTDAFVRLQGFQLVPAELSDLWAEIRGLDMRVFAFWFTAAMLVKLVGIFANVWRWQVLLQGQGIDLKFGFLSSTYFIGRYFGIVTPSTMGLDAWRLYESAKLTQRPIECTTALAVERVIGLVGLLVVILLFMPFAGRLTQGQSFGEMVGAMKIPLAGTAVFGTLVLLRPTWFRGLLRAVPSEKVRRFAGHVIDSATAYSTRRSHLLFALLLAIVGQLTTTLMYFCNAMSLSTSGVHTTEVLFASAVMTFGTFVAPSASGEGVRELVFVWLLGSKAGAVKAFLIGNLGFWIEKVPLSIPGGIILLLRRDPTLHAVTREELESVTRRNRPD